MPRKNSGPQKAQQRLTHVVRVKLAWIILRQQDLRTVCTPHLERLRQATNETVSLYIHMGTAASASKSWKAVRKSHTPTLSG